MHRALALLLVAACSGPASSGPVPSGAKSGAGGGDAGTGATASPAGVDLCKVVETVAGPMMKGEVAEPLPRPAIPGAEISTVEESDQWFAQWPSDTDDRPIVEALKACAFLAQFAPCCAKRGDPPDLFSVMSSGVVVRVNPATAGNGPLLEITR